MTDRFHEAIAAQVRACLALGSPFTARLLQAVAAEMRPDSALGRRVALWPGDLGPASQSVPLRIAGGLHALVRSGDAPDLAACYPPHEAEESRLRAALRDTLRRSDAALCDWVQHAPQTNEVARAGILLAAAAELGQCFDLPLSLSELGASAGLNLWFDRYALEVEGRLWGEAGSPLRLSPDWQGPLPPLRPIRVAERQGVDLHPLSPARDGARLMAFIWADQSARLTRLQQALRLAGEAQIEAGDAAQWLEARLTERQQGCLHLVYHTIAFQYFPSKTQARIAAAMASAGARATPDAPLAWLGMEADGRGEGAAVTVQLWPGGQRHELGRAGFHGQWVAWRGMQAAGG